MIECIDLYELFIWGVELAEVAICYRVNIRPIQY